MKKIILFYIFCFITCPGFAEISCDVNITDYHAFYRKSVYICESGYFLPANTDGCQPCPYGYTCNGGTFTFNKNVHQGAKYLKSITNSKINKACADNFPIDLYAIYEPNTVTITWDDGDGNTTNGTCEYGGELTLPTEPTRAGYTFSGWKVKSNN